MPVGLLTVFAGLLGWKQGWIVANVTESDAIALYAARYAAEVPGADPADCRARPDPDARAWLTVICGPEPHDTARHVTYRIDRSARLLTRTGPGTP